MKIKENCNTLTVPCEKSKTFSCTSAVCSSQSRFAVQFICCIAFG